jgi:hypothetical protein
VRKTIISFAIFFLILNTIAIAHSITLSKREVSLTAGETEKILLTIKNEMNEDDIFLISIWPERFDKVAVLPERRSVRIPALMEESINITVSASEKASDVTALVKVFVTSMNLDESVSDLVVIKVKRKFVPLLEELELERKSYKMDEVLQAVGTIKNLGAASEEVVIEWKIVKGTEIIYYNSTSLLLKAHEIKEVSLAFPIKVEHEPGKYELYLTVIRRGETIGESSEIFMVEKVVKYTIQKVRTTNVLGSKIDLVVKNIGNCLASVEVRERMPLFLKSFMRSKIRPKEVLKEEKEVIYIWEVSVEPGEEEIISYQLMISPPIVAVVVISVFSYFAYIYTFGVSLSKISYYEGSLTPKDEIPVCIEVRNKSRYSAKNIKIEDFVPGIAKVMPKFETLKPKLKRKEEGTVLTWRIPSLKAGEERVITYRIKPVVNIIGTLKLPGAKVSFTLKKKKQARKSGSVLIGSYE